MVKRKAECQTRQPELASEVRSFRGLVTYSAWGIPNLYTIAEPLTKFTKQGEKYNLELEKERSFKELKCRLAKAETLAYFDQNAKKKLVTYACPLSLSAVSTQE